MTISVLLALGPAWAGTPTTFDPGSLVIPMDVAHHGSADRVLPAYGLAWHLLSQGVPLHWVIDSTKSADGVDLTATTAPVGTSTSAVRDYRAGPLVVDAAWAVEATAIIDAWPAMVAVHELRDQPVTAEVDRVLASAPTPVILDDTNQDIAIEVLNAVGIPDPLGGAWAATCGEDPDDSLVCSSQIEGLPGVDDGILWLEPGVPAHCAMLAMHATEFDITDEVRAELRSWLGTPVTTLFGQCDAIDQLEHGAGGNFLTPGGATESGVGDPVEITDPAHHLVQFEGRWTPISGAWRGSDLLAGTHANVRRLLIGADDTDALLAGPMDGDPANGQVVYLGGHHYELVYDNEIAGVRVLLNALLGSGCADAMNQPELTLGGSPDDLDLLLDWSNLGAGSALTGLLTLRLPDGLVHLSDDAGGVYDSASGQVSWDLGAIRPGDAQTIAIDLDAVDPGSTWDLSADLVWVVGATKHLTTWADTIQLGAEPPTTTEPTTGIDPTGTSTPTEPSPGGVDPDDYLYASGGCGCAGVSPLHGGLWAALLALAVARRRP